MMDHSEEFVWRGDGEEAEIVVYAPDADLARQGFVRARRAAALPGAESPVFCAISESGYGHVLRSPAGVSPGLASPPERGLLLAAELPARELARRLGVEEERVGREVLRRFGDSVGGLPRPDAATLRRVCEVGAEVAAGEGVIEEEDLAFLGPLPGDGEAVGRRALLAGEREWGEVFAEIEPLRAVEVLDSEGFERFGVEPDVLLLRLRVGSGDLGRLAFRAHRERIAARVLSGTFDRVADPTDGAQSLPVAPAGTEEVRDFLLASAAAANYADALISLSLLVCRRALGDVVGGLSVRTSWRVGGVLEEDGASTHRDGLAAAGEGDVLAVAARPGSEPGGALCAALGTMGASAPPFSVQEDDEGRWPWEEVGLLGRLARLGAYG